MKFFRSDLHKHRGYENHAENRRADQIAAGFGFGRSFTKPGHGDGIAAGFAEGGRQDLNDPERKRDLRNFTDNGVKV